MAPPKLSDEERIRRRKESQQKYYEANKAKENERGRKWREENTERIKQYYVESKDAYIDRANKWRKENHERRLEIQSSFKKRNRAASTADTAKYRADKDNRTPKCLTEFDHLHIKCLYQVAAMRTRESGELWSVDHVIALRGETVSGLHVPWNMAVITLEDNTRKNNKLILPEDQMWA